MRASFFCYDAGVPAQEHTLDEVEALVRQAIATQRPVLFIAKDGRVSAIMNPPDYEMVKLDLGDPE